MSLLKSNSVQIGQSATATQNFTLSVPASPDGTIKLARGNSGATTQDILSVNASGAVTLTNGGAITLATAQASTSGTAIDFTGIPSWVRRITVMLNGVSVTGGSSIQIQIGSSTVSVSGYVSNAWTANTANNSSTSGFLISGTSAAGAAFIGNILICTLGSNVWVESHSVGGVGGYSSLGGGSITLGGSLDRIRLTTVNGTDTFDAGSVNIMYEG